MVTVTFSQDTVSLLQESHKNNADNLSMMLKCSRDSINFCKLEFYKITDHKF